MLSKDVLSLGEGGEVPGCALSKALLGTPGAGSEEKVSTAAVPGSCGTAWSVKRPMAGGAGLIRGTGMLRSSDAFPR